MPEQDLVAMRARLKEIGALRDGWLDGRGIAPTRESVRFCGDFLAWLVVYHEIPVPHLYPTEEGGIQAEWTFGSWEVEAVFDFRERVLDIGAVNIADSTEQNVLMGLDDPEAEVGLAEFIRGFMDA